MRVRAANPSDAHPIARVHVDTWRTTYTGIVPAEYLAGLSYRDRESRWEEILAIDQPTSSNFVAETEGGDVVGFAGGGPEREGDKNYLGELYAIYLLEGYQRKRCRASPCLGCGSAPAGGRVQLHAGVGAAR